jgi:hypothetical protein
VTDALVKLELREANLIAGEPPGIVGQTADEVRYARVGIDVRGRT